MKTKYFIPVLLTLVMACGGGGGGSGNGSGSTSATTTSPSPAEASPSPAAAAADTTVPTISTFSPADVATDVAVDATIEITFDEAMDSATVTTDNLTVAPTLSDDGTTDVCTSWSLNADNTVATCTHGDLAPGVSYTVTATTALTDDSGNALAETTAEYTTTSTASANNPVPRIVIPSFDGTTGGGYPCHFFRSGCR